MKSPSLSYHQPRFTAAQIGRALERSKGSLLAELENAPADGELVIRGQKARAWSLTALPAPLQIRLEAVAQDKGYRNPEQLLKEAGKPVAEPVQARSKSVGS